MLAPGLVHVADDDASFRTAIERRLKKAGYEIATAWSRMATGSDRLPVAETSLSHRTIGKSMREAYRV
jgi:FixJ family two-component response regulator